MIVGLFYANSLYASISLESLSIEYNEVNLYIFSWGAIFINKFFFTSLFQWMRKSSIFLKELFFGGGGKKCELDQFIISLISLKYLQGTIRICLNIWNLNMKVMILCAGFHQSTITIIHGAVPNVVIQAISNETHEKTSMKAIHPNIRLGQ